MLLLMTSAGARLYFVPFCTNPNPFPLVPNPLLPELPVPPTHGALASPSALRMNPLQDTVHVECVVAYTPNQRAVVPRHLAVRATAVEVLPTDSTRVILSIPRP